MGSTSIRLHRDTYNSLKEMKENDETTLGVLYRILEENEDNLEKVTFPDIDIVALPVPQELNEKVNSLAGDNASADDVVTQLIEEHNNE